MNELRIKDPTWAARLEEINAHALRGRVMQSDARADARAELAALVRDGSGASEAAQALRAIVLALDLALEEHTLESLEARTAALEALVAEHARLLDGMTVEA